MGGMSYANERLVGAIGELTSLLGSQVTNCDLNNLEQRLNMKLSQIKANVATLNANLLEGLAEIQAELARLVEQNADPEVTDEAFTANLQSALEKSNQIANIANGPTVPTPPVEDTTGEPVTEPAPTPPTA